MAPDRDPREPGETGMALAVFLARAMLGLLFAVVG